MEYAREQSWHCRSSKITIATFAPRGGFSEDASAAKAQALEPSAASKIMTRLIDTLMNKSKMPEKAVPIILREKAALPQFWMRSEMKLKAAAQRARRGKLHGNFFALFGDLVAVVGQ